MGDRGGRGLKPSSDGGPRDVLTAVPKRPAPLFAAELAESTPIFFGIVELSIGGVSKKAPIPPNQRDLSCAWPDS